MRCRLTAALLLAALIIGSASGCHVRATAHAAPALRAWSTGR